MDSASPRTTAQGHSQTPLATHTLSPGAYPLAAARPPPSSLPPGRVEGPVVRAARWYSAGPGPEGDGDLRALAGGRADVCFCVRGRIISCLRGRGAAGMRVSLVGDFFLNHVCIVGRCWCVECRCPSVTAQIPSLGSVIYRPPSTAV